MKEIPLERKTSGYNTNKDINIERQPSSCHREYQGKYFLNSANNSKKEWMNDSYDKLLSFLHVYTNHLLIGNRQLGNPCLHHYSIIRKIRKKYVTITYYTIPKG